MKILILNGSPRNGGNTKAAVTALEKGITTNLPHHSLEVVDLYKVRLSSCLHCDSCRKNGGECITKDDSATIAGKIASANVVVFASPVYFTGINAQLKMAMDKMYSKNAMLQGKKIGLLMFGEAETNNPQYRIIREQFECISDFLGWEILFSESYSTPQIDTIKSNSNSLDALDNLWRKFA